MVRLELVALEKVFNVTLYKRTSSIGAPTKWFVNDPYLARKARGKQISKGPMSGLLDYFLDKFVWFQFANQRRFLRDKALTPEDCFLHPDKHIRRNLFFEHIMRECLHPYHWILKVHRRSRFYRVSIAIPGFRAPQFVVAETLSQSYRDLNRLEAEWSAFVHHNIMSDTTPALRATTSNTITLPLDLILMPGICRDTTWSKFFMNEEGQIHDKFVPKDTQDAASQLRMAHQRSKFEKDIKERHAYCPGVLAPEGQEFDFEAYYKEIGL